MEINLAPKISRCYLLIVVIYLVDILFHDVSIHRNRTLQRATLVHLILDWQNKAKCNLNTFLVQNSRNLCSQEQLILCTY